MPRKLKDVRRSPDDGKIYARLSRWDQYLCQEVETYEQGWELIREWVKGPLVTCKYCGEPFYKKRRDTICKKAECRRENLQEWSAQYYQAHNHRTFRTIKCRYCGKIIRTARRVQECCSEACSLKLRGALRKGARETERIRAKKVCPKCGTIFIPTRLDRTYCSKACRNKEFRDSHKEFKPIPSQIACPECGKMFTPRSRTHCFCSSKCLKAFRYQERYWQKLQEQRRKREMLRSTPNKEVLKFLNINIHEPIKLPENTLNFELLIEAPTIPDESARQQIKADFFTSVGKSEEALTKKRVHMKFTFIACAHAKEQRCDLTVNTGERNIKGSAYIS